MFAKRDKKYNLLAKESSRNDFNEMIELEDFRYHPEHIQDKIYNQNPY